MVILVMGVTGSGKTTVGKLLAGRLHWEFADADDFHSPQNKLKMHQGIPLNDDDRAPWLAAIRDQIATWLAKNINAVVACSALKRSYRDILLSPAPNTPAASRKIQILYLRGTYSLITARLRTRAGHFAGESILASQFASLEEPAGAITIDINQTPSQIVDEAIHRLNLPSH
jgi:gluconokinase